MRVGGDMPLTDTAIKQAKAKDKPYRLADGGGMYLEVTPAGSKYWRLKYRYAGKEKRLALGVYPSVSLKEARDRRSEAKRLLGTGLDPSELKRTRKLQIFERAENGFEIVAREWFEKNKSSWAASHSDKLIRRLERDVFPWIGSRPVNEITAGEILGVLRRIEKRGAIETAHRAKQECGQIFRYAIATQRATYDHTPSLKGALTPVKHKNFPALTNPKEVGELMRKIRDYKGSLIVRSALQLAPHFFVRPSELREAEWSEINFEESSWTIPGVRIKSRKDLLVPLSTQTLAILKDIYPYSGDGQYVFPGRDPKRPFSAGTINKAIRSMGYDTKQEMTGHGFRAMARTILQEKLKFNIAWIELQLAHVVPDPNGTAYNRAAFLDERREMMQAWSDYLIDLMYE